MRPFAVEGRNQKRTAWWPLSAPSTLLLFKTLSTQNTQEQRTTLGHHSDNDKPPNRPRHFIKHICTINLSIKTTRKHEPKKIKSHTFRPQLSQQTCKKSKGRKFLPHKFLQQLQQQTRLPHSYLTIKPDKFQPRL